MEKEEEVVTLQSCPSLAVFSNLTVWEYVRCLVHYINLFSSHRRCDGNYVHGLEDDTLKWKVSKVGWDCHIICSYL